MRRVVLGEACPGSVTDELQGIRRGEWTTTIEVDDRVAIRLSGDEYEGVVVRAAAERIVANAPVEHVGAIMAVEQVVAGIAVQFVSEQVAVTGQVALLPAAPGFLHSAPAFD